MRPAREPAFTQIESVKKSDDMSNGKLSDKVAVVTGASHADRSLGGEAIGSSTFRTGRLPRRGRRKPAQQKQSALWIARDRCWPLMRFSGCPDDRQRGGESGPLIKPKVPSARDTPDHLLGKVRWLSCWTIEGGLAQAAARSVPNSQR
jgi:hypothetical protein